VSGCSHRKMRGLSCWAVRAGSCRRRGLGIPRASWLQPGDVESNHELDDLVMLMGTAKFVSPRRDRTPVRPGEGKSPLRGPDQAGVLDHVDSDTTRSVISALYEDVRDKADICQLSGESKVAGPLRSRL
jgi:hypothetical protein